MADRWLQILQKDGLKVVQRTVIKCHCDDSVGQVLEEQLGDVCFIDRISGHAADPEKTALPPRPIDVDSQMPVRVACDTFDIKFLEVHTRDKPAEPTPAPQEDRPSIIDVLMSHSRDYSQLPETR